MRRAAPIALLGLLALIAAAPAAPGSARSPQVSISDVEDEVMCPICGTLLELSDSPQARREKAFIARMIAAGRSKAEIKDALVAEYGSEVLALPKGSGFDLAAYLVPAVAFAIAGGALAVGVLRWRRRSEAAAAARTAPPDEGDAERLDADIGRYDL
jgi:cytochrome c-type biogenesis protein CcmH/NrfF